MKSISYFYPIITSFVETDKELLKSAYKVRSFHFDGLRKVLTPLYFVKQLWFLLRHSGHADVLLSQFSGYHSFLPALAGRIFRKPHLIILHGTECNNFPEYHYGYLRKRMLHWFSWKSMQWSTLLLPVSESLVSSEYTYAPTRFRMQGFQHFYKNLHTPHQIVYNGVDIDLFPLAVNIDRSVHSFITIASGLESSNRRAIKGIDLVIELARLTPENLYTVVGGSEFGNIEFPSNIKLIAFVPHDQLHKLFNQNAFYLQLSASEGFGLALCEAMLCGCIPIVSNVGILPTITGDSGYVLETKDVQKLKSLIKKAISEYTNSKILLPRKQIIARFNADERKKRLLEMIEKY